MPGGSKIDPATGRRRRDKVLPVKLEKKKVNRPVRNNGKIVRKGRLTFKRSKTV